MKKKFSVLLIILTGFVLFSCNFNTGKDDFSANIDDKVKACFDEVNAFRTGNEA